MKHASKAALIARIETYCAANNLNAATFCDEVAGDARFLSRLKNGGDCLTAKFDQLMDWFDKQEATIVAKRQRIRQNH